MRELAASALEQKDFSRERFSERLQPLAELDFSRDGFQQASGQGRSLIRRVILLALGVRQPRLREDQIVEAQKLLEAARS